MLLLLHAISTWVNFHHFLALPSLHPSTFFSAYIHKLCMVIRESVDSLCRDGADRTRPFSKIEWLITPKRGSYKPF